MICIYFNQKIYSPFVDYLKLVLEEKEVGRFRYYYNYNSCADLEESIGAQFEWDDVGLLKIGEIILDLDTMSLEKINNSLGKYYGSF